MNWLEFNATLNVPNLNLPQAKSRSHLTQKDAPLRTNVPIHGSIISLHCFYIRYSFLCFLHNPIPLSWKMQSSLPLTTTSNANPATQPDPSRFCASPFFPLFQFKVRPPFPFYPLALLLILLLLFPVRQSQTPTQRQYTTNSNPPFFSHSLVLPHTEEILKMKLLSPSPSASFSSCTVPTASTSYQGATRSCLAGLLRRIFRSNALPTFPVEYKNDKFVEFSSKEEGCNVEAVTLVPRDRG